jgi:hypothetical protein
MLSSLGISRAVRAECCLFQSCSFKSVTVVGAMGQMLLSLGMISRAVFLVIALKRKCVCLEEY